MTLRFIEDTTEPEPWDAPTWWRPVFEDVHRIMRATPYRDDRANVWAPLYTNGDCQQKVCAALETLYRCGVPLSAMRGYVGGCKMPDRTYDWHACLVVRVTSGKLVGSFALDHLQIGMRWLFWLADEGIHVNMAPAMRAVADGKEG